jgi:hypothetical protein
MPLCLVWKEGLSANIPVRLARDPRLASRKVVILHYTERMLWPRAGKWNLVNLPGAGETKPVTPPVQQELRNVPASGVIKQASPGPDTKAAYPHYIMKFYVENLVNLTGRKIGAGDGVVHVLAMHNRKVLPAAVGLKPGAALKVMLTSWSAVEKTHGRIQSGNLDDVQLEIEKPLYWGVIEGQPVLTEEELERVGQEDDAAGGGGKTAE